MPVQTNEAVGSPPRNSLDLASTWALAATTVPRWRSLSGLVSPVRRPRAAGLPGRWHLDHPRRLRWRDAANRAAGDHEQFGTLESLPVVSTWAWATAPGSDQADRRLYAVSSGSADDFPEDAGRTDGLPGPFDQRVIAVPGTGTNVPGLAAGFQPVQRATGGERGLPYAFASISHRWSALRRSRVPQPLQGLPPVLREQALRDARHSAGIRGYLDEQADYLARWCTAHPGADAQASLVQRPPVSRGWPVAAPMKDAVGSFLDTSDE